MAYPDWYTMACPDWSDMARLRLQGPGPGSKARPKLQGQIQGLQGQIQGLQGQIQGLQGQSQDSRVRVRIPGSRFQMSRTQLWSVNLLMFAPDSRVKGSWGEIHPSSIQSMLSLDSMTYCMS